MLSEFVRDVTSHYPIKTISYCLRSFPLYNGFSCFRISALPLHAEITLINIILDAFNICLLFEAHCCIRGVWELYSVVSNGTVCTNLYVR